VHASVRSLDSGQALLDASKELNLSLVVMDVDDDDSVSAALGGLQADRGPIDVLVNNAGIATGHSVEETSVAEFRRVMNTNTWGTLRCIHAVLPSMRERTAGHIVNVTSISGRVAVPGQGAYCASKFAAEALTEVLAAETKPFGIRVTMIEPGVIMTPIFEKGMQDPENPDTPYVSGRRLGEYFVNSLMGTPGTPDMVADAIWRTITDDDPELRHLVGDDAVRLAERRLEITDEEWIARHSDSDDDRHRAWMSDMSGVQVNPLPS
jgi:NAD(P)-dependent dehydrogenase (short-subunit alcohol dehydrogenase family)